MRGCRTLLAGLVAITASLSGMHCQMRRPIARGLPPGASTVCVFGVRGVRAFLRETPGGMDVTFTVVGNGAELKRRAHAALIGQYPMHADAQEISHEVHASIVDEPDGLVIHTAPKDPARLEAIRDAIRRRIDEDTTDECL